MKFLIAAGGTGGHITPGLAIGTMLKNEGHEVIFIGTEYGLEKDLIPKWLGEGRLIGGEVSKASFIDIGTPDSLKEYKEKREEER